jgi:hypothetical protein
MKRFFNILVVLGLLLQPGMFTQPAIVKADSSPAPLLQAGGDTPLDPEPAKLPGYQDPPLPIPYNRPGYTSMMGLDIRANMARTAEPWATQFSQLSADKQISKLDYGTSLDPFASNYTLVNWDNLALVNTWENGGSNQQHIRTFKTAVRQTDGTFNWYGTPPTAKDVYTGQNGFGQTQAADINSDGVDEIVSVVGGVMQVSNLSDKRYMLGAPTITSPSSSVTWQFVRGYDNQLWVLRGASWAQLGGTLTSAPTAFSPAVGRVDVLVLNNYGTISRCLITTPTGTCAWDGLAAIGNLPEGSYNGTPVMTGISGDSLDVFARSSYNILWHRAWRGGWQAWENLGYINSTPSATASPDGQLHVVARGMDNDILHTWRADDASAWAGWESLGGIVQYDPIIVNPADGTFDVFVTGTDNLLYRKSFSAGAWDANWAAFAGTKTFASPAAVVVRGSQKVQMLHMGSSGVTLFSTTRDTPTAGWSAFIQGVGLGTFSSRFTIANYGNVQLGHFLPNGRVQMINTRVSAGKLYLDVYEFLGGFYPNPIKLNLEVPVVEAIGASPTIQTAAGDFYGYGVEQMAVHVYSGSNAFLYVVHVNSAGDIQQQWSIKTIASDAGKNTMLTHGNYNGDVEKIADEELGVFKCAYNNATCVLAIYDIAKNADTDVYSLTQAASSNVGWNFNYAYAATSGNFVAEAPTAAIRDEMESRIIQLTNGNTIEEVASSYKEHMILSHAMNFDQFAPYQVRINAADLDRDGQAELTTFWERGDKGLYSSHQIGLIYYKYEAGDLKQKGSWVTDEDANTTLTSAELVSGDFAGEGLRMAKPTYRVVPNVGNLVAHINTPPKIVVDDVVLNATSSVAVSLSSTETQEISVEANSHWNLDTTLSGTLGNKESSHITATLTGSVGQDFSKVDGSSQTFTRTETFSSAEDDILLYATTDFQLFEYAVMDGSTNYQSNITVTWPMKNTFTVTSETATSCNVLFNPGHDILNPLSYASTDADLPGYTAEKKILSGSYTSEIATEFQLQLSSASDSSRSNWTVGAEVEGAYSNPAFEISASLKGEYGQSTTATQKTSAGRDININGTLANVGSDYQHTIEPYLYWNNKGTLVLDYVIKPGNTPYWGADSEWNQRDLAFIRPWKVEPCGQVEGLFNISPDITFSDSTPLAGDVVTAKARVRNYSITDAANVLVNFYRGDPAAGGEQITCTEGSVGKTVSSRKYTDFSCTFTASGFGEKRIYAVADPNNTIVERVEDNNKAFAILSVVLPSSASGSDPGRAAENEGTIIKLEPSAAQTLSLFVPYRAMLDNEVTTFKLNQKVPLVRTFEFEAVKLNEFGVWTVEPQLFGLALNASYAYPPVLVRVEYTRAELAAGMINENTMSLYYFNPNTLRWVNEEDQCGPVIRDPDKLVLLVPICHTGTYTLSDSSLPYHLALPFVKR